MEKYVELKRGQKMSKKLLNHIITIVAIASVMLGMTACSASDSRERANSEACAHEWTPVYQTIEHAPEYEIVHHDAVYETVHHEAEYGIVHHDAVTEETEKGTVTVQEAYDEEVLLNDAYDEELLVKEAWDEEVLIKDSWTEKVLINYDCSKCGERRDPWRSTYCINPGF